MAQPTKRPRGRPPAGGPTPKRNIRVGDEWDQVEALAAELNGETMTDVVKRLLGAELRKLRRAKAAGQLSGPPYRAGSPRSPRSPRSPTAM